MGQIEQLVKSKLLGNDNPNNLVWPITKTRAVYDKTNTDLQTVLDSLDSEIQEIKEINNVSVRYDQVQELTEEQKETARENIDAGTYSKPEGGIPASDLASGVIPETPFIPGTGEGSATLKPTMIWETGGATKPPLNVTGEANATTYQYNCASFEPQEHWYIGMEISVDGGVHVAEIVSFVGTYTGTLTVSSTLSEVAIEEREVYYKNKFSSTATGKYSVSEGTKNLASGDYAHAEGKSNIASGHYSHVEGADSEASGQSSHAEGWSNATKAYAHSEGENTSANGVASHAEGDGTHANGIASHAEGGNTVATGTYSHTSGSRTEAKNTAEFALGEYNKSNTGTVVTRFSIGNGTYSDRKNIVEILADGRVFIQDVGEYDGTNPTRATDLATLMSNVVVKRFSTDQQIGFKYPLDENQHYTGLPYIALVREMSSGKIALVSYGGEDDYNATKVYDPGGICEKFVDSGVASWSALRFVNNHLTVEVAFLSAYKGQTVEGIPWGFPYTDLSDKIIRFEETSNKVTTLSAQSTDLQYPSAKAVWDMVSSKYTKPSEGIPASDLTQTAQTSLAKADTALQSADLTFIKGTGTGSAVLKDGGATATGQFAVAEGAAYSNTPTAAAGDASHAEGAATNTKAQAAHSEGLQTIAGRTLAEAQAALSVLDVAGTTEQKVSKLIGFASHSEGSSTQALGTSSHAEGNSTQALVNATHAEGDTTTASGEAAHSEGYKTTASGNQSHSEGFNTQATANQAHSEGKKTIASAENAHSEGNETKAVGNASHSEGYRTYAYGAMSHIEGTSSTLVSDANAASESVESIWEENGHNFSLSRGQGSHVEGKNCLATGDWSHAEGNTTNAVGDSSHAEGSGTEANNASEHAEGRYNKSNKASTTFGNSGNTIHSVGIGASSGARTNAFEIMQNGDIYVKGLGSYNGTNPAAAQTLKQVIDAKGTYSKPSGGIPASDLASGVIPTVPQISTNITTDASSNTKTASPKAVKDYVDANGMKVVTYGTSVSEIPSAPLCYVSRSDVLDIIPDAGSADDQITSEPGVYLTRQDYSDAEPEENVRYSGIYSYYTFESNASVHRTCVVTALYNAGDWELEVHDLYDEIHPTVASSQPSGGFVPNVMYNLGTLSGNTTFALATPVDANIVNHYYWAFDTGSTAPTITWPSSLSWFGGSAPTINASKHYEISVLNGIAVAMEV